jgi:hypothetical protein
MRIKVFSAFLGLGLALAIPDVQAETILSFSQLGTGSNFTATNTGSGGSAGGTSLSAVNIPMSISGIAAVLPTPVTAYFNLTATSVDTATLSGGHVSQNFQGSFSITGGIGGSGINYLSGTFASTGTSSGATLFGSGSSLVFSASSPDGITDLTSSVIGALYTPRAISLSFANVTPQALSMTGPVGDPTIPAFTSSVAGTFSASVPEPASLVLMGIGMAAMVMCRHLSKRAHVG